MNNEETICSIQHLPYEVLCKIFDYLDIWNVKQCSRTCQRWKNTIFSDCYIKRFQLNVKFPTFDKKTLQLLEESDRLYWNMNVSLCHLFPSNVSSILNGLYTIFCYPKLEQLVALKISFEAKPNNYIKMITDAIARMKVLRELCIENNHYSSTKFNIFSNSIQLLVLKFVIPTVIKAPKLSSLRISLRYNNKPALYFCRLPSLKSLKIEYDSSYSLSSIKNTANVLRFFNNLQYLEKLDLEHVSLSGYLFKAICENCTNLTEFSIETLFILENSTLHNLSKLAKLQHLQLENVKCLEPVSFQSIKLPNLKSLGIGSFPLHYETLEVFKSVTKITILSYDTTSDFIAALAIKMQKLKHVEFKLFCASALHLLHLLTSVEVLTVTFPIKFLINVQYSITTIKEIHCSLESTPSILDIARLRLHFPTLQLLTAGKNFKHRFQT